MSAMKRNAVKESISVVIPAFNESVTIESVAKEAQRELKDIAKDYELVLVDDGSRDGTGEIIDRLAKRDKHIRAVHHKENRGFTGAIKTSFKSARKDLVFLAPADGQFDFSELKKFVVAIPQYDVAIGYRIRNEEGLVRKLNSRVFHLLCRFLLGIKFKEISSVSLWRRNVIQSIKVKSHDRSAMFLPEVIHKALKKKYKFVEVPINWRPRMGGIPKGSGLRMILKTIKRMIQFWFEARSWK